MASGIRQLLSESLDDLCDKYCDDPEDHSGYCLSACLDVCSDVCRYPIPSLVPSPNPDRISSPDLLHNAKSKSFMVIAISVIASVFILLCCFAVYVKYYYSTRNGRRRRSSAPPEPNDTRDDFINEDHGPEPDHHIWYIRTVGLQPSVISSIAVCKYKRGDGLVEGTDCAVCLSDFQEDESLRLLPKCSHAFHIPCIDTWLRSHTSCPICRAPIVANPAPPSSSEVNTDNSAANRDTLLPIPEENGEAATEIQGGGEEEETGRVQPMRRSVSLDSVSALKISEGLRSLREQEESSENSLDSESGARKESNRGLVPRRGCSNQGLARLVGSSSAGRPLFLNRSLSCTGKFLLSRCRRSRSSADLPLRSF